MTLFLSNWQVAGELALELLEATTLPGAMRVQKARELLQLAKDEKEIPVEECKRLLGKLEVETKGLAVAETKSKNSKVFGLGRHLEKDQAELSARKRKLKEAEEAWQKLMGGKNSND